jgi:hypothetical protein
MPELAPYTVEAYNTAKVSENKIHDDAVAKKFGFGGGLVPGVDVYAYMTHLPVERWGRAWLEHGIAECRFSKPVYDRDLATVTATEIDGGLDIRLESRGILCATGTAALPAAAAPPSLAEFEKIAERAHRPPADDKSLAVGAWLGIVPFEVTAEVAVGFLSDVRETSPLYAREGLVHPVAVLRRHRRAGAGQRGHADRSGRAHFDLSPTPARRRVRIFGIRDGYVSFWRR